MSQFKKIAVAAAAFGLLLGASAARADVTYSLTLTPTSGTFGGTGTFSLSSAPLTGLNQVSNYYQTPKSGSGTLESLSITIDGQTFNFADKNNGSDPLVQFTSGLLDDITYAGTSNGDSLMATSEYVFTLSNNNQTIGTFKATVALVNPVPEPATLALFGTALVGFGALRRWKRKTA